MNKTILFKIIFIILILFLIIFISSIGYYFYLYKSLFSEIDRVKNISDAEFYSTVHITRPEYKENIKSKFIDFMDSTFLDTAITVLRKIKPSLSYLDYLGDEALENNYYVLKYFMIGQRIPRDAVKSYSDKFGFKILLPSSLPDNLWFGDIDFDNYKHEVVIYIGNKNNRKDDFYPFFDIKDPPITYVFEYQTKPENWDDFEKSINNLTNLRKIETNNFLFVGGARNETVNAAIVIKDGILINIISRGEPPLSIDNLIEIAKSLE